ncbi:hypothetical protein QCA50_002789 [Cerrena zonata]|uniref:Uncharacterized protein n=1 Tax=Cerrena zonata TaxID=2478898 RepID=A0AAW0GHT0_9APHY
MMQASALEEDEEQADEDDYESYDEDGPSLYDFYGGYDNFMHSYGLKPWDDDDIDEGATIITALHHPTED